MANRPLNGVLKHVRKLAAIQSARLAPDHALLQQYVAANDEAALNVLVERHGPMVLGVCRRALRCAADAEDACQATFLVFSCKAASIRRSASLASWLHGVAVRVAAKLKRETVRRKLRERNSLPPPARSPVDEVSWAEVQMVLDEELQALPERYRGVLILCYLDGKTRDEAAKELGLTIGTLHGLLERGRKLLADRLTRRGLTLSAGLLGMAVCAGVASAALSSTQVLATAQAAALFAAGQPVGKLVSAGVLTLSQQVLKGMIMTKLKFVSAALLGSVLMVSAIGVSFAQPDPITTQPGSKENTNAYRYSHLLKVKDTDEAFIRRLSKDLRGVEPTPAEIHFFVTSKEAKKREKLVDLFIAEREAKKKVDDAGGEARAEAIRTLAAIQLARVTKVEPLSETKKPTTPSPDLALLKTNVQLAELAVQEKSLLLKAAQDKYKNVNDMSQIKTQIELLQLDLARARVLLQQAEFALASAQKKATAK